VAEARDLNLERRADLEQARDSLNDVHVELGTLLERENVLRRDGVMEAEPVSDRFHYHRDAVQAMEGTIRQEMRADGLTAQQIEDRDWEVVSKAERRIETEQRAYLEAHPDLLARPGDVIDRSEPYRETITDAARASEITREVDRIMEARDIRTPVAEAVTDDVSERYPDMPSHLARGLGATYAAVVEIRDTEAISQVRRENEMRDRLGSGTRDEVLAARVESSAQSDRTDRHADEIARVLDHERAGELSAPFETAAERDAFRSEIARVLDFRQLDRLTSMPMTRPCDHVIEYACTLPSDARSCKGRNQLFETMKRGGADKLRTWSSHKGPMSRSTPPSALGGASLPKSRDRRVWTHQSHHLGSASMNHTPYLVFPKTQACQSRRGNS
jgi:type IV secretion system T-DNA border endonuclease VirD2